MIKKQTWMLFLLVVNAALAQDTIHFTKALMVAGNSRYGREAIYTDLLAWKLYNGTLENPKPGGMFDIGAKGDTIIWKEVMPDNSGRFRTFSRGNMQRTTNPFLNPGYADRGADYLYFTHNSPKVQTALLYVQGNSGVYFNGAPHMGDPYSAGYMFIPVLLKKGLNEIFIRGANVLPALILPQKEVFLSTTDLTLPSIVINQQNGALKAAVTVINTSAKPIANYQIVSNCGGRQTTTTIATVPALTTRKVIFEVDASAVVEPGKQEVTLTLKNRQKAVDERPITIEAVGPSVQYSNTFISGIDGSLQYYAVAPQVHGPRDNAALFLSVHGAGVEAIGQARAYQSKDWGTLVAATNRRPRGFNWEDWGRLETGLYSTLPPY